MYTIGVTYNMLVISLLNSVEWIASFLALAIFVTAQLRPGYKLLDPSQ